MTEHILVVDDDATLRAFIVCALEDEGYAVESAANGVQALAAIEERSPSLMLLDLQMPVLDGWGVVRNLQRRGLSLPIVVITALPDVRGDLEPLGVHEYLRKPFALDDLLVTVKRLHAAKPEADAPGGCYSRSAIIASSAASSRSSNWPASP